ncbi:MAG: CidA/LrgA family protein [Anaerolineae bacterium]|nr:CidA/LrgA family protein [Anaerolineae bacterium]MCB9107333.1 CidA/LrgA family protein [Anaerolineales bacterium]
MVNAIIILLSFQLIGEIIIRTFSLPVPGPVVGMLLLFVAMLWRDALVARVEETAQYILQNLTLLYVPAAVGVVVHLHLLQTEGLAIIITLVVSTLITISVTSLSMKVLLKAFQAFRKAEGR